MASTAAVLALLPTCRVSCCSTDSCSHNCLTKESSLPLSSTSPADVEGAAFSTGAGGASIGCCAGASSRVLSDVASCFATQRSRSFCCPMGTFDFLRSSASKQLRVSSDENPIATTTLHVSAEMFRDAAHARTFVSSSASCWASAMVVYCPTCGSVIVWHGTDLPVPYDMFIQTTVAYSLPWACRKSHGNLAPGKKS